MHTNPSPLSSLDQSNSRFSKKPQKNAYKTQINLKNRRRRNVPQIKIQLDEMLTQAYHEIKMQPKKNVRIGNTDLYILDNQVLRDYVTAVYDEYHIDDPLANIEGYGTTFQKNRSSSNAAIKYTPYHTPQKASHSKNNSSTGLKKQKKSNKTTERLSKLKKNFQEELQSVPTSVIQTQYKTTEKKMSDLNNQLRDYSQKKQIGKRQQIKINRRSSQRSSQYTTKRKIQAEKQSHLLTKTKHKYCLMCQQPLENDIINKHQKSCQKLQELLNTPNLNIEQIGQILDEKILNLENQLRKFQRNARQDLQSLQQIITSVINKEEFAEDIENQQQNQEQSNLMKSFSMLHTIKCMQNLDKLQWFKKMKAKAQMKNKTE